MDSRINDAAARHNKGYNCAQAVACTYADLVGVPEDIMFAATEGLGLGMGGMEGTCGALSGACVLAGFLNSTKNLEKPDSKGSTYKLSRAMVARFNELSGATQCKVLKGVETGKMLTSCPQCVENGARVVEEILFPSE